MGRRRHIYPCAAALACVVMAFALLAWTTGAGAASTAITVTANIPSASSLTNNCTQSSAWNLGTVLPGASSTTATGSGVCSLVFGSSNDTSMLRFGQKDGVSTAMASTEGLATSDQGHGTDDLVSMATANDGWAATGAGFLKTANGGSTWTPVTSPGIPLSAIIAVNSTTVVVGGQGGEIRRSTDGGTTWNVVASPVSVWIGGLDKTSASNLYGFASGANILKSSDGGATWSTQVIAPAANHDFRSIGAAPGTNTVYIGDVECGCLYKTTDGTTWNPTAGPGWTYDVASFDGTNVYASNIDNQIYVSTNGGASWTLKQPTGIGASFDTAWNAIEATAAGTVYAFGVRGSLVKSTDFGVTWTQQASATTNSLYVSTSVGGSVWAGGNGGVIVNTTNGGATWNKQRLDDDALFGVSAINSNVAWAVGGGGDIRKTTDGSTWNTQASGITTDLNAVSAVDSTHAFAVGAGGKILGTTNGTAWNVLVSGPSANLWGVAAVDANIAWAVGDSGTILKTTNGGISWSAQTSGTGVMLHAVAAADYNRVYAVGDNGVILKTNNGGATWVAQTSNTTTNLQSVTAVTGADDAWVAGSGTSNIIRHTTDGGATPWQSQNGYGCCVKYSISAADARNLYLGEPDCVILRSSNSGASWDRLTPTFCSPAWGVSAVDANVAFFVSDENSITKTVADAPPVSDYGAGTNWGSAAATNMFGFCIQHLALSAVIAAPYVEDTVTTPGVCTANDTDPWAAVPAASTKIANTSSAGQTGQVDVVWGVRMASNQAKGTYRATVLVEVLAPSV